MTTKTLEPPIKKPDDDEARKIAEAVKRVTESRPRADWAASF